MLHRKAMWLGALGFTLVVVGCTSWPPEQVLDQEHALESQPLPGSDGVPLEWGRLVSVTQAPSTVARLWFEDDSGVVRIVNLDVETMELGPLARAINRR